MPRGAGILTTPPQEDRPPMLPGRLRSSTLAAAALVLSTGLAACTGDGGGAAEPPTPSVAPTSPDATSTDGPLTVGMYGTPEELVAYQAVADSFNNSSAGHEVELVTWRRHDAAMEDILAGDAPDVFMSGRSDLRALLDRDLLQPVSRLLDERGVDFGDRYSRDAVDSFAVDDDLQCMAYSISPMVMYYNTDLIDFERMERRGLEVPSSPERWTLEEFTAAARFATRGRSRAAGVHIEPSLRQLAPFVYSGGGSIFDDEDEPTSLSFNDESSREALDVTLSVLRDSTLTLTDRQLEQRTPLQWFKRGKLAMMAGFRDLVPQLRAEAHLPFDVISMPVLDSVATVGDVRGLCLSADSDNVDDAADFISYAISDVAVERVVRTGSVVPANTSVAGSDVFLSPGRLPANSQVFNTAVRGLVIPPLLEDYTILETAVAPLLDDLLHRPGILDLDRATARIDEASRPVFEAQGYVARQEDEESEDSGE